MEETNTIHPIESLSASKSESTKEEQNAEVEVVNNMEAMNNHEEHGFNELNIENTRENTIEEWKLTIGNTQNIFNTKLNNLRNTSYKINKLKKQHL